MICRMQVRILPPQLQNYSIKNRTPTVASIILFWISIRLAGLAWKKGEPLNSYRRGGPSTPNGSARFVSKQAIVRDAGNQALEEGGFTIPEAQYQTFEIEVETNRNPH